METDNLPQPSQPSQPARPKHIPRSPNAFMFYSQRQRINSRQLGMNQQMLSTIIGKKWHNLSESQKNHYKEMAEKAKSEHKIKYPNYKYIPKSKKKSNPSSTVISRISKTFLCLNLISSVSFVNLFPSQISHGT